MKRSELEHVIRAAGAIADDREVVVIGSQAVLGQFPNAPAALLASAEADVFPLNRPELADLIEGSIGEGSAFHELYGYCAQGVDERTATLPCGWRQRLVKVMNANTNGIAGMCFEVNDLAISKYVAGRPKDLDFTRELARHRVTPRFARLWMPAYRETFPAPACPGKAMTTSASCGRARAASDLSLNEAGA
ncbi:MAG: DUF6036 family nucleotidyltransferase [Steroidobacteraceae bacterium]